MGKAEIPAGYRARPTTFDDAEGVANLIAAVEETQDLGTKTTVEDVRDDWRGSNLGDESLIIEDPSGTVVANVDVLNRRYSVLNIYGAVHPEHEGKGLGRYLVEWGERWAFDHMDQADPDVQVVVRHFVHADADAALNLFATCGYDAVRTTYVMAIDLHEPPPTPVWPEGIVAARYRPGVDERAIYEAVEDAFRDTWGRPPSSFERFLDFSRGKGVKPDLWILARASDEVAGVLLGTLTSEQGWIPTIGVRRAWRRRGLGLALLHAGFGAYYRRGVTDVRLSVDVQSPTGASRLYERAGMHVASNFILHEKVLREGIDIGLSPESQG